MKFTLIALGSLIASSFAFGADSALKTACWTDVAKLIKSDKKNCKEDQTDAAIFNCVEHHEKKVSKNCYAAHEEFEKTSGKGDND